MKETATIFDYERLCNHFGGNCQECPMFYKQTETGLSCEDLIRHCPDKANEVILNWCKKHPVETRQDRFLKMFPNAGMWNNVIKVCPNETNMKSGIDCGKQTCETCKRNYWLAEVEVEENE